MRKTILILASILAISLMACASSRMLYIPNTLPYEVQQTVKTAESKDIRFAFEPHPAGDLILLNLGPMWNSQYSINAPFQGTLLELLKTKFVNVSEDSANQLTVRIKDLQSETISGMGGGGHTLKMAVYVQTIKDGLKNSKTIAYTTTVPVVYGISQANEIFRTKVERSVKRLLLKFVTSIDRYLDANRM